MDDLNLVRVRISPKDILLYRECDNSNCIPRSVYNRMEPCVKDVILEDYWIPKDVLLPLIKKGCSPYKEVLEKKKICWHLDCFRKCAFHGVKMYATNDNDVFYCPICDKFYSINIY